MRAAESTEQLPPLLAAQYEPGDQVHREVRAGFVHYTLVSYRRCFAAQAWEPEERQPAAEELEPAPAPSASPLPAHSLEHDSPTEDVAAWCAAGALIAQVVGAWVWVQDSERNRELGGGAEPLGTALKSAGFAFSRRRQAWFHKCGVAAKGARMNGKLERYHGTAWVEDYQPAAFDTRPAWLQQREREKAARKARRRSRR